MSLISLTVPASTVYDPEKSYSAMHLLADNNDNIYIADRDNARILKYNPTSQDLTQINVKDPDDGDTGNNIQIHSMCWGKNKETFIVSGKDDLGLYQVTMNGNAKKIAGSCEVLADVYNNYLTDCSPAQAAIGQCPGLYCDDTDGYIYILDGSKPTISGSGKTCSVMKVLVPGLGGDYAKGKIFDISKRGSGPSADAYLNAVGGMTKVGNTFYIIANSAVMRVTPKAAN